MSTKDGFTPDHPLPLFLSNQVDEEVQRGPSRLLKASTAVMAAAVICVAVVLALGNPAKVVADLTASLTDVSALQADADQSTPAIQSTADTQALQPTARDAPARDETSANSDAVAQSQPETSETPSGALLKQFQIWAAEQDAKTQAQPAPDARAQAEPIESVPDARAPVEPVQAAQDKSEQNLQNAEAPVRPVKRHRRAQPVQNARAEIRSPRPQTRIPRHQAPRAEVRPAQVQAQEQAGPYGQPPSFLQSLGLRDY